jgi:hypothetical protein
MISPGLNHRDFFVCPAAMLALCLCTEKSAWPLLGSVSLQGQAGGRISQAHDGFFAEIAL